MKFLLPPSFCKIELGEGKSIFKVSTKAAEKRNSLTIVVNADDLGYCDERDEGIIEAFERGIVSSTSVRFRFFVAQRFFS